MIVYKKVTHYYILRGRAAEARQPHKLNVVGSNPTLRNQRSPFDRVGGARSKLNCHYNVPSSKRSRTAPFQGVNPGSIPGGMTRTVSAGKRRLYIETVYVKYRAFGIGTMGCGCGRTCLSNNKSEVHVAPLKH